MRNQDTATYELGETLTYYADAVVFLTATPLHLRNRDLYNLLHLLTPEDYHDPDLFEEMVRPNAYINRASKYLATGQPGYAHNELRHVEDTALRERFLRNPYYKDVLRRLVSEQEVLRKHGNGAEETPKNIQLRVALQRELLDLHTLSTLFVRTRKRDVANAAVRSAHTVKVRLSPTERAFYDGVLQLVVQELRATGYGAPAFAIINKERQAASCLAAMRETFQEAGVRSLTDLRVERSAFDLESPQDDPQVKATRALLELSRQIGDTDAKFDLFEQTLRQALEEGDDSKALVFSFFRRTLEYLRRRLRALGYQVDVIHGGVPIPERRQIIERFRTSPAMRVLLSSEVGAEGLDFQFCDVVVNYDLPWNPMQVEQRIGRLDRFGQEHEKIRIYSFYIEDTIETRIFQRLYDRIRIFEESIGDLEAILGEEIRQLSRQVLQAYLTPAQQARLAEQAAERIVQQQMDARNLEERMDEFLGQAEIFEQQVRDTVSSGRVVSGEEVRALVSTFLSDSFPRAAFVRDREDPCWTLRLDGELANHLDQYMREHRQENRASVRFRKALAEHRTVALTFDSDFARQRSNLEFITARHPLAGAAIAYWQQQFLHGIPATRVAVAGPQEEWGDGYFFIYLLDVQGIDRSLTLQPVIVLNTGRLALETARILLGQLQSPEGVPSPNDLTVEEACFTNAERIAAVRIALHRDEVQCEAQRRHQALVEARSASVKASFEAKIQRTKELLWRATDERIRRMRIGQIAHLEAQMQGKLADLRKRREVSASYKLIAGGVIRIEGAKR